MQQWTISWSDCDVLWKVDFIQQPSQWSYREEAPKNFPKPNLHQIKGHGHCLVICYLSDPLQLSEFWWNHYIWEVCSADWWDASKTMTPAAGSSQHNGLLSSSWQYPTTCHTTNNFWLCDTQLQKLNELGYKVLPHPPYSPDLPPTDYHFFKHLDNFLQGEQTLPQPAGGRKHFLRVYWILKHGFLHYRNK